MTETDTPDVYAQGRCDYCGHYGQTHRYTVVSADGATDRDVCPPCSQWIKTVNEVDPDDNAVYS